MKDYPWKKMLNTVIEILIISIGLSIGGGILIFSLVIAFKLATSI